MVPSAHPKRTLAYVLAAAAGCLSAAAAGAAVPPAERDALIAVYHSTGGDGWIHNDGWAGVAGSECSWYGVTCDAGQTAVTSIVLSNNRLTGPLPDLDGLAYLRVLGTSGNQLSGTIPDLGGLTELTILNLWDNQLNGPIPGLDALTELTYLNLSRNQLSGPIPDLDRLTRLADLRLTENQLSGTIPDLGSLTELTRLQLHANQLSGSIPDLGGLVKLQILDLWRNQLSGTIPDLGNLAELEVLNLSANQLSGTIPELGHLTRLTRLELAENQLSGTIPELANLTELTRLLLHVNHLSGPLPEVDHLTRLQVLNLWRNQLTGTIPELGQLTELTDLVLAENQLTGAIPDLGALTELNYLDLGSNHLSGPIPDLGGLNQLEYLFLHGNQLNGEIPDLSQQPRLVLLDLSHNRLSGSLPELGHLSELTRLRLAGNRLLGEITPDLWQLTRLADGDGLDLRWNGLHTSDPAFLEFLNGKQIGGDLPAGQTLPPADARAEDPARTSIDLSWTPIAYAGSSGRYRARWGTAAGGPYPFTAETAGKTASGLTVAGLEPGTTYHFVVETETDPHGDNQNTVVSLPGEELGIATLPAAELLACAGFQPPMAGPPVPVRGPRVLPLKARLFDPGGEPVTGGDVGAWPKIRVLFDAGSGAPPVDVTDRAQPAGTGTDDGRFVFSGGRWRFNLKTKNFAAPGLYLIGIESSDAAEYEIDPACAAGFVVE